MWMLAWTGQPAVCPVVLCVEAHCLCVRCFGWVPGVWSWWQHCCLVWGTEPQALMARLCHVKLQLFLISACRSVTLPADNITQVVW